MSHASNHNMYLCPYIYIHAYMLYMYIYVYIYTSRIYTYIYVATVMNQVESPCLLMTCTRLILDGIKYIEHVISIGYSVSFLLPLLCSLLSSLHSSLPASLLP